MAENTPRTQTAAETNTFRERKLNLTNGTLYIVEQLHGEDYRPDIIAEDVKNIRPHAMMLENVGITGVAMPDDLVTTPDIVHQLNLAAELGIPVVFPDVVGSAERPIDEIMKTSPATASLLVDFQHAQQYYAEKNPQQINQLITSIAFGSGLMTLGLLAFIGRPKEGRPLMHRRQLLKILAGSLAGAAVGYLASQATFGTFPERTYSTSGNLNARFIDRLQANIQEYAFNKWHDSEEAFKLVLGLRNTKFISTAEQVATYLFDEKQFKSPSIALLVGQAHSQYLENKHRHATAETRTQTAYEILDTLVIPMYKLLKESAGNDQAIRVGLYYWTCHELARIAASAIHTVHRPQPENSVHTLTMQRAFVSPEIHTAIIEVLDQYREPELLKFYLSTIANLETASQLPENERTFELAAFNTRTGI